MYPIDRYGRDPYGGLGEIPAAAPGPIPLSQNRWWAQLPDAVKAKFERLQFLVDCGEPFALPVALGLGTTPASGTTFNFSTANVDFDLAVVGLHSTIRLSTADIRISGQNRAITNATAPIAALADFTTSSYTTSGWNPFRRPFLLPAKTIITGTITADGTESNGTFTFRCLQPPMYQS